MLNEDNQIHNFISSSGSGTLINYGSGSDFFPSYGSGSTSHKVTVPPVLVPQHSYPGKSGCGSRSRSGGGGGGVVICQYIQKSGTVLWSQGAENKSPRNMFS
jgi:hypothetical protein